MRGAPAWLVCVVAACGDPSSSGPDADRGTDAATCAPECVEGGWWVTVSSDCAVICMGSPTLAECMQSDCKSVQADRYDGAQLRSLAPMLHSAQNRSFYLFGSVMTNAYSITPDCMLQIPMRAPRSFECSAGSLRFSTAVFTAASSEESGALDAAASTNAPGRYAY